jgi:filamentous hemagglutinin family protein
VVKKYNISEANRFSDFRELWRRQMKQSKAFIIAVFILTTVSISAHAADIYPRGIELDGTLGNAGKLDIPGPEYQIKAEYGRQAGANLFHSFRQFNLHSDESAVFTGPGGIQNIISRVTGGDVSWIDGKLSSHFPGADMYFLNPAGIIFGPNVSLDLQGSFHASTADYLRIGTDERFYAVPRADEILSADAPSAFGFIADNIAGIHFEGRGEISAEEWDENRPSGLHVSEGNTISLVGGDIEITKGVFYKEQQVDENGNPLFEEELDEDGNPVPMLKTVRPGDIKAPGGQIRLISAASSGEADMAENSGSISSIQKSGKITVSDMAKLDVSGEGGGRIYIRSGEFVSDRGRLEANTLGAEEGMGIEIESDTIDLNGARIIAITYGSGAGGHIKFHAKDISLAESNIFARTEGSSPDVGNAGAIEINSDHLLLDQGSQISTSSLGTGQGGNIKIQVNGGVRLSGEDSSGYVSAVYTSAEAETEDAGNSGNFELTADQLWLEGGAYLGATTYGPGKGGDIKTRINDILGISGENSEGYVSGIFMNAEGLTSAGDGGTLELSAGQLRLENGGQIISSTFGSGQGGNIKIGVRNEAVFSGESIISGMASGVFVDTQGESEDSGNSGNLELSADRLRLENGAEIAASSFGPGQGGDINLQISDLINISGEGSFPSGIFSNSQGKTAGTGNGGSIALNAKQLDISGGGQITAATFGPGEGGAVNLQVSDAVRISAASETTGNASGIYASSMSENQDSGNGGRIEVKAGELSLNSGAMISTSSKGGGKAGEIHLNAANFELGAESFVSSESHAEEHGGDAGTITVDAEDSVRLTGRGALTTEANGAGGGKIFVNAGNEIYLLNGGITSSVKQGEGNGGDVTTNSKFVILNEGNITANAEGGDGGAIFIRTDNYIRSSDSKVTATSKRGNDGTVKIEAPDTDVSKGLTVLPGNYLDAARWLKTPCSARTGEKISRFVMQGREAMPTALDDWLPGPGLWFEPSNSDDKRTSQITY